MSTLQLLHTVMHVVITVQVEECSCWRSDLYVRRRRQRFDRSKFPSAALTTLVN
jgi:hypothetical protein